MPVADRVFLRGYVDSRLRDLVGQYADDNDASVSDCVAFLIAGALDRLDLVGESKLTMPKSKYTAHKGNGRPEPKDREKVQLDSSTIDQRLLDAIVGYANDQSEREVRKVPVSECVARLVAKALRRPDLAGVPRKRRGRPREW